MAQHRTHRSNHHDSHQRRRRSIPSRAASVARPLATGSPLVGALCALLATGCGGEDATSVSEDSTINEALPGGSEGATVGPFYAVATEVYGADFSTSTSFIQLVSSLEVAEIDLASAREYNGRATLGSVGNWLFIMDGEQPIVERFSVAADGSLTLEGELSFANYGMPYWTIDAWGNTMVSPTKAYFSNPGDGSLIVWNPSSMEIVREIPLPTLAPAGLELQSSPAYLRGDQLFRLFSWASFETFEFSRAPQQLGVYDTASDELSSLVEDNRCPAVYSEPFADEAGALLQQSRLEPDGDAGEGRAAELLAACARGRDVVRPGLAVPVRRFRRRSRRSGAAVCRGGPGPGRHLPC